MAAHVHMYVLMIELKHTVIAKVTAILLGIVATNALFAARWSGLGNAKMFAATLAAQPPSSLSNVPLLRVLLPPLETVLWVLFLLPETLPLVFLLHFKVVLPRVRLLPLNTVMPRVLLLRHFHRAIYYSSFALTLQPPLTSFFAVNAVALRVDTRSLNGHCDNAHGVGSIAMPAASSDGAIIQYVTTSVATMLGKRASSTPSRDIHDQVRPQTTATGLVREMQQKWGSCGMQWDPDLCNCHKITATAIQPRDQEQQRPLITLWLIASGAVVELLIN